jgi:hypothetical protein
MRSQYYNTQIKETLTRIYKQARDNRLKSEEEYNKTIRLLRLFGKQ